MQTTQDTPKRRPSGTIKSLSKGLNISSRRVQDLLRLGMPDDLDGAKRWREQKSGGSAETLRQRRIELVAEQKEKLAIANRVRRGELIEAAAAFESSARVCAAAKTRLLAFERDLPPQLEGASAAQIAKILHREIVRVLTDLSQGYRDEGLA